MVYDPSAGDPLPDGSRIQHTTVGDLADWLAANPAPPCGCANPQPYNLCCPSRILYPAYTVQRNAPRTSRRARYGRKP